MEAEDTTSQASTPEVSRAPSRQTNSAHQPPSTGGTPSTPGTPGSIPSDTPTSGLCFFISIFQEKFFQHLENYMWMLCLFSPSLISYLQCKSHECLREC